MFIKEKYSIRHKILSALYVESAKATPNDFIEDISISIMRLSESSMLTHAEIYSQTVYLLSVHEIKSVEVDYSDQYYITSKGLIAYHNHTYLEEGKSQFFKSFKEWITLVSIIVAIIISVFTFISNYLETKKNSKAIEDINTQLKRLDKV